MPIGDLLASISGGSGKAAVSQTRTIPLPKRKAEEDIRPSHKLLRRSPPLSRPLARPNAVRQSSNGTQGPTNGSAIKSTTLSKPLNSAHRVSKPPPPTRPPPSIDPKAPPKKGSFAEIMARGKAAQATFASVGKIQHKKAEKGAIKRDKDLQQAFKPDPRALTARKPATNGVRATGGGAGGYTGTAKPNARITPTTTTKDVRSRPEPPSKPIRKPSTNEEQDKKAKKAAVATTGYTGTARPRPQPATANNNYNKPSAPSSRPTPRGGALLNGHRPPAQSKSSRYDDYDEELDDFIEYDDDEEDEYGGGGGGGRPNYHYDSGSDSDMEAGMDELDLEERRAEAIARREDIEEERREKQHKLAKEERKRKALEEMRARRR